MLENQVNLDDLQTVGFNLKFLSINMLSQCCVYKYNHHRHIQYFRRELNHWQCFSYTTAIDPKFENPSCWSYVFVWVPKVWISMRVWGHAPLLSHGGSMGSNVQMQVWSACGRSLGVYVQPCWAESWFLSNTKDYKYHVKYIYMKKDFC